MVLAELHCLSIDNDAACHVGIVMMEVINLAEMSEYFNIAVARVKVGKRCLIRHVSHGTLRCLEWVIIIS